MNAKQQLRLALAEVEGRVKPKATPKANGSAKPKKAKPVKASQAVIPLPAPAIS